jgi:hypothetical protein
VRWQPGRCSPCKPYLAELTTEEWAIVDPDLMEIDEDALQRHHDLHAIFNVPYRIARA